MKPNRVGPKRPLLGCTGHELGVTYRSRYWRMNYRVMCLHANGFVTVKWADGHHTTHITALDGDQKV